MASLVLKFWSHDLESLPVQLETQFQIRGVHLKYLDEDKDYISIDSAGIYARGYESSV